MEPPFHSADSGTLWIGIAHTYVEAIQNAGVTKVIHLSSIGKHTKPRKVNRNIAVAGRTLSVGISSIS